MAMQEFSGTFPVSVEGTIGYPILGNIPVANRTTAEISSTISQALLQHIPGLSVSVAMKEYAPVFVIGDVQKPGRYEFRPGMIALELFALSGGLKEAADKMDTAGTQLVTARQDYSDTSLQLYALDVRRARLQAELAKSRSNMSWTRTLSPTICRPANKSSNSRAPCLRFAFDSVA